MMFLKLIPNVEVDLPLKPYYGVTLVNLNVGDSGITNCIVKAGIENFSFKAAGKDNTVLYVNGDPSYTPTHRLFKDNEKMTLMVPEPVSDKIRNAEVILEHYLSYSVPTSHNKI